jgi:2-octaprenylphenol hydroxylase
VRYNLLMKKIYDAIIIGAGVNGLTQAAALAHAGFRVAIIDQAQANIDHSKDYDLRVYAINRYTQQCLEQWDIWQNLDAKRIAAYHQVNLAFHTGAPSLHLNARDDSEPNLGHIVEQKNWRNAALELLENSEHCDFYWQHSLEGISWIKDETQKCVSLTLNPHQTLHTQLLIGADGVQSKVRTLCDIQLKQFPAEQTALIFNIHIEHPHHFEARQYFCQQGIMAFLPLADAHHYSMVWSIPDEQLWIKDLPNEALVSELQNISQCQWGEMKIISPRQAFPLIQRQAQRYIAPHIALIGDAAHVIHPLAGQGANLGVADAAELTRQLCRARLQHRALGSLSVLRPYERARRSAAWQMMGLMDFFQKLAENRLLQKASMAAIPWVNKLTPIKNILTRFALYNFTK